MKTNDKDIEKVAVKLTDQRYANCVDGKYYAYKNGVKAGFKACEAKMMEESAKNFEDWWRSVFHTDPPIVEGSIFSREIIEAFTAGRLSGAKEAEERIKRLEFMVENGLGWEDMKTDTRYPNG